MAFFCMAFRKFAAMVSLSKSAKNSRSRNFRVAVHIAKMRPQPPQISTAKTRTRQNPTSPVQIAAKTKSRVNIDAKIRRRMRLTRSPMEALRDADLNVWVYSSFSAKGDH